MNFARLNHILIPDTKEGRDRMRGGWVGKLAAPLGHIYSALSEEGRVLFALAMTAGFVGLDIAHTQNHLLWASLVALVIACMAVRPLYRMPGVRIEIEAPNRPTVGEEAIFHLTLVNDGERDHHGLRCERPFLPWDGEWTTAKPDVATLRAGQRSRVAAVGRFRARGRHHLDAFTAGALVPLGLAVGDRVASAGVRFTVVPRIPGVKLRELPGSTRYQPGGIALASSTGESTELVGLRPYRHGDRPRDLHARTWARIGAPVVREYHQEYFSRIGVVLDTDAGAAGKRELEAAISLAGGILARLERGDALIDLLVTGELLHPLTLGRSLGTIDQALDHLACVEPGTTFDPGHTMDLLRPHLDRLSCVFVVALRWDEARAGLVEAIRLEGVAARGAVVTPADGAPVRITDPEIAALSVPRIERACEGGEELAL